jgi:hypothetical protein
MIITATIRANTRSGTADSGPPHSVGWLLGGGTQRSLSDDTTLVDRLDGANRGGANRGHRRSEALTASHRYSSVALAVGIGNRLSDHSREGWL